MPSSTQQSLFILDSAEEMQRHIQQLLEQGKHKVAIFSRTLNPLLFNHIAIVDAVSAIARSSPNAEVSILVQQPQVVAETNHLLLDLYRRLPSKIQCRKVIIEPQDDSEFMLVDDDKLWLQHKVGIYTGFANYDDRPQVKQYREKLSTLWLHSEEDARLRSIIL